MLTCSCHSLLLLADGGRGFEGGAQDDVLPIGNAALYAAAAIRSRPVTQNSKVTTEKECRFARG